MQFIDKKGRVIEIEFDGVDSIAAHKGKEIGKISFEFEEFDHRPGKYRLFGMNIDAEFRRAGIATELMRAAVADIGGDFKRPGFLAVGGSQATSSEDYFTDDGMAFFQQMIKEEIVRDQPAKRPYEDRYDDDN